jgi:hypothetical protein
VAGDGTTGTQRGGSALPALLAGAALLLAGVGAALALGVLGGETRHVAAPVSGPSAPTQLGGCSLLQSPGGYPAGYITRSLPYRVHPPLPVSGWHGPAPLHFDVLFHSLFHGYVVVAYRPDLPASDRAALRSWVGAHAADRVVATPTPLSGGPRLDLAEWGWELRCDQTTPSAAELDSFVARRTT